MNRIHQADPATSTGKTEQLFTAVHGKLGFVPNLMRVLGNSPAALEGYLNFSGALAGGVLAPRLREQIALAVYTNNVAQTVIDFPEVKPGKLEPETCTTESCECSH